MFSVVISRVFFMWINVFKSRLPKLGGLPCRSRGSLANKHNYSRMTHYVGGRRSRGSLANKHNYYRMTYYVGGRNNMGL